MDKLPLPAWIMNTLGLFLILFVALLSANQFKMLKSEPQTLNVSATGKATRVPDLATVSIGAVTDGTTAIEVKDRNTLKMNQLISFIKQTRVGENNIQTTDLIFHPNMITPIIKDQLLDIKLIKRSL